MLKNSALASRVLAYQPESATVTTSDRHSRDVEGVAFMTRSFGSVAFHKTKDCYWLKHGQAKVEREGYQSWPIVELPYAEAAEVKRACSHCWAAADPTTADGELTLTK